MTDDEGLDIEKRNHEAEVLAKTREHDLAMAKVKHDLSPVIVAIVITTIVVSIVTGVIMDKVSSSIYQHDDAVQDFELERCRARESKLISKLRKR